MIFCLRQSDKSAICFARQNAIYLFHKCNISDDAICCPRATQGDKIPFLVPSGTYRAECISLSAGKYRKSQRDLYRSNNKKPLTRRSTTFLYSGVNSFIIKSAISIIIFRFSFSPSTSDFPATDFTLFLFFFLFLFPELLSTSTLYFRQLYGLTHFFFRQHNQVINPCISTGLSFLSIVLSSFFTGILGSGNSFYRGLKIELLTFPVLQNRSSL